MTEPDSKTSETSPKEVAPVESQAAPPFDEHDAEPAVADTVAGEVAAAEAESDTVAGGATPDASTESSSGEVEAEGASTESSSGDLAAEGEGKKKRRRRRKKKGAQAGPSEAPPDNKPAHHHAPFLHLFSGGATRRHAFSVGEEIAGRVERVEHGVVIVDVFGKATAIADVDEPREIPHVFHEPHVPLVGAAVEQRPAPPIEAAQPEAAPPVQGDIAGWQSTPTEVNDLPEDDLAEADTVVGAQAYVPSIAAGAALAATEPPKAEAEMSPATVTESEPEARAEAETHTGPEADSEPHGEPEAQSETEEDPADADLTLLDALPQLEAPQAGAIFRGRIGGVAESGHIVIVNRVIDKPSVRKALRAARDLHQRVHGVVYGYNRGGFDVLVGGVRAFCPASAMSLTPIEDPNAFIGQRCEFSLPQDKGGNKKSIIVSRRSILEKEARKKARERMGELAEGTRLRGKVLEVRDYGVLVDLGDGLDGLVHMSEVSWSRGTRPQDAAKVGDEVDVEVLKVQPASRKDRFGRVSLSMRACQPDPWDAAKDTLKPGMPIKGKVVRTTDFGAFIELQENIEGLLHISELGGSKELTHAKQAVTEGDEIDVVVERVDREQRRISLSKLSEADAKAIEAGEIELGKGPRSLKPGSHVAVVVKRVEHNGAQVQVDGMLGKRGRGFIPSRELQDMGGEKRKGISQGDVIEVKVIGTERDGTLRCSVRARLLDEERKAVREYRKESAKQGLGTFGDLLKAKLGETSD